MVLRASRLRPAAEATGPLALSGTVSTVSYLGESFEIDLAAASGPVRMVIPSDLPPPAPGQTIAVEALPGAVTFI
ncbi:TOBE domain-containing protein [Mangrovicoccus ximenensis]|uniref:TOBE domain-containing protein n=1 Tax=Mangrovicoccus ximenensis TaxID=1911570 RepID=UPI000D3B11C7|nr:TOBE domain-containing protein [Mangrovicoccus ximenensis]